MNVILTDNSALCGVLYDNNHYLRQCRYTLHLNTADRLKQRNQNNNHSFVQHQRNGGSRLQRESKSNSMQQNEQHCQTSTLYNTALSLPKQEKSKMHQHCKNAFVFPNIDIKLIDEMHCTKDLFDKVLTVNFGQYFMKLFPKSLSGTLTVNFVETVQKYLKILTETGKLDSPMMTAKHPNQSYKSKRAFLQKIGELQNQKNFRAIEEMIKHCCVPNRQFRQNCLRDILRMLSQSLYERFNLNKEKQYILLDESGSLIEQFCSIRFTTTSLMVSNKQYFQSSITNYKAILQRSHLNFAKISLTESWYRNFRETIVSGRHNESVSAYETETVKNRAKSNQLTHRSLGKSQKLQTTKTERKLTVTISSEKQVRRNRPKSSATNSSLFSKLTNIKMQSIESKKRYQVYEKVFQKLKSMSNIAEVSLSSSNSDKLAMSVFKMRFQLFKGKSTEHIDAVLNAFQIDPKRNCISKSQFITINEVAMCKGEHSKIVEFVCRYLPFNEYGEFNRESLSKVLKLSLKNVNSEELVLNIVWNWLERNGIVEDDVVLRNTLQSWYGNNKMAFAIMISLIFGTHSTSLINVTHQVFI